MYLNIWIECGACFFADNFMPPIDALMGFSSLRYQRERFYDDVNMGDVFCCTVEAVNEMGLNLGLLCYACDKNREIEQLRIHVSHRYYLATPVLTINLNTNSEISALKCLQLILILD